MRRQFGVALLLPLGACALFEPSERRFVIFFKPNFDSLAGEFARKARKTVGFAMAA